MKIIGGSWLKERNNYDVEMCRVNGWECIQGRYYDAIIKGMKYEIKKTKTSSTIIKLQQLAEILIDSNLSNIWYLVIRTDAEQENIIENIQIKAIDLCNVVGMTLQLARQILHIHSTFNCTLQCSIKLKDLK